MDRKRQKKVKKWDAHHDKYVKKWLAKVNSAKKSKHTVDDLRGFDQGAFDNYLAWFVGNTRVELCPPAYDPEILEEHDGGDDDFYNLEYNKLVREGHRTKFAPLLNFVVISSPF